ncbi:MAG: AAA family ATPase [Oscillospiraceae bacterium]|nr:MAG: AAA family ATPase [Oscillospiraceae bacterium]
MAKVYEPGLRLRSLVIFRNLLQDPVISALQELFDERGDIPTRVRRYANFAAALYEHGDNLSDYILSITLCDENPVMVALALNRPIPPCFEEAFRQELKLLEQISRITSDEMKDLVGYKGFLPSYNIAEHDFRKCYGDRLVEISRYGYGIFVRYRMFLLENQQLVPVQNPDPITLAFLPGYESQRKQVYDNTLALIEGRPAANVLLYGDSGTGKSSTVKAVVNELYDKGLRLIELKKSQIVEIPSLLDRLSTNPLHFILFIDDLSFTRDDDTYATLKAVLEGSVSSKTSNVAIYATSNRRHLIKESFADREGDDIHYNDTIAELTSLSDRFGLTVTFEKPNKETFIDIVAQLADLHQIDMPREELFAKAEAFALHRSGRSPRVAKQFIESLLAGR